MVSIGTSYFSDFQLAASIIKWLKFERENGDEFFYHSEGRERKNFVNVTKIHVVCADGFRNWGGAITDHNYPWPCADENLFFIDPWDGRIARGLEVEEIFEQMQQEMLAANGDD